MFLSRFLRSGRGLVLAAAILLSASMMSFASSPNDVAAGPKKTVSGTVVDDTGTPVIGAVVLVQGNTSINTITDANGMFSLDVPTGSTVEIDCIGFVTYTFKADGMKNQNIKLMSDVQSLEETVVVGYGTQKKASLTGAISSISDKALAATTQTDLVTKLQGKVSGLNIRYNSGTPGSYDNVINVRGFGTPIYIIDGINRTSSDFNRLNSEDIESISVLKDASAAIYGLNAGNGVIIVTTRQGNGYGKTRFQFNSNFGISSPTDQVEMADGYEYYYLRNAANINAGDEPFISQEELAKWKNGEYKSTDWAAETFKKFSTRQEYSLSADGGSDKVKYYINVNYTDTDGLLKSGDINYDKWSFRSTINAKLTNDLRASVNIAGYSDMRNSPASGFFSIWRGTVNSLPYKSVYANDNTKYYNNVKDGQSYNPVALSYSDNTGYSRSAVNSIQATFNLTWNPTFLKDLTVKGTAAYDKRFVHGKGLTKNWKMYTYDESTDTYSSEDWNPIYSISSSYDNVRYLTLQAQATYKKKIADAHNINASFIFETRKADRDYDSILKYYDFYTNDQIDYASDTDAQSGGNESKTRNMSYVGKLNYDYKGKYLLEFAARYDGSYRYDPSVRWGFFPVASIGYRISEEKFMKNIKWLSNLKFRASAGQIGEDVGTAFQYISGFTMSGGGWTEFTQGVTTEGVATPALVNKTMTWTKSDMFNIGLDASFFDNTLSFTIDVYRKNKTGILAHRNVTVPNTFGADFPYENLNSNRTQGIEFSLGYQNRIGDFFYNINGNVTFARTMRRYVEHSDYQSSWAEYRNGTPYRWSDIAWVYNVIGQFQSEEEILNYPVYSASTGMKYVLPGDWKYEDVNGDGVINTDDLRPISLTAGGSPLCNYGLTISGSWRGLDFNILFQGAAFAKTYHNLTYTVPFWQESNIPTWFMNSWHHEDPYDSSSPWVAGDLPAVRINQYSPYLNQYASTKSYLDASYLRIKNVELGYTFSQKFVKKAHIDKVRIFVSGSNLYTFCNKYVKAYDPETSAGTSNTGWVYPLMCTYNGGINLYF